MKQEEIDRIVAALQALPYEHHDGFNRYSIESIRSVLASLDQTGIDLREVEKLVQKSSETHVFDQIEVTSEDVLNYYEELRQRIGYTLSDLEQFKNDEG